MKIRRRVALNGLVWAGLCLCPAAMVSAVDSGIGLSLGETVKVLEGPTAVSPPAIRFDASGSLHVAWFEKKGMTGEVKTVRLSRGQAAGPNPVRANPEGLGPDAIHQSPGLAVGPEGRIWLTWSSANKTPGAMFASDILLARSMDGGASFSPPVQVNDDGKPIPHTFEDVTVGPGGEVYLGWLDGRNKDRSGAGAQFACSRDGGVTVEKNLTIDGMACPCCRPMVAMAPDGTTWMAWRKTFEGNVRDIVIARSADKGTTFSSPLLVSRDGWVFDACPHRGPSIGFDGGGRLYVGWYTEGKDEQPRLLVAASDDLGRSFSPPISLHTSTTSLPDNLRMAVHPNGTVLAVWEEVTGVRKRVVARVSTDRGQSFGSTIPLSSGSKAEHPSVVVHRDGAVALAWTEHAFPNNRVVVQWGTIQDAKDRQP